MKKKKKRRRRRRRSERETKGKLGIYMELWPAPPNELKRLKRENSNPFNCHKVDQLWHQSCSTLVGKGRPPTLDVRPPPGHGASRADQPARSGQPYKYGEDSGTRCCTPQACTMTGKPPNRGSVKEATVAPIVWRQGLFGLYAPAVRTGAARRG